MNTPQGGPDQVREPVTVDQLVDALKKAEAVLSQVQEHPDRARDIVAQGYFGHALVRARRLTASATTKQADVGSLS